MKKFLFFAGLCALVLLQYTSISQACGKKFLVKARHASKVRCFLTDKPGIILIYRDSEINSAKKGFSKKLVSRLSNSGHEVHLVENKKDFEYAIKYDKFDAVLVGYSAAESVGESLKAAEQKAKIVPVVDKKNKTEVASAKEKYGKILKDRDRTSTKILTINAVLSQANKTIS